MQALLADSDDDEVPLEEAPEEQPEVAAVVQGTCASQDVECAAAVMEVEACSAADAGA